VQEVGAAIPTFRMRAYWLEELVMVPPSWWPPLFGQRRCFCPRIATLTKLRPTLSSTPGG